MHNSDKMIYQSNGDVAECGFAPADTMVSHKRKAAPNVATEKRNRKIIYQWSHQSEVSALITAVKKRMPLWDCGCSEYRLANMKNDYWKEVAAELEIPDVDAFEARNKWNAVRSLFKANLYKFRARKSGQATADTSTVSWAHFTEMMFIESAKVLQSSSSTSTMPLEGVPTDASILSDSSQASTSQSTGQRRKNAAKPRVRTSTTQETSSLSSHFTSESMRDVAAEVLTTLHTQAEGDRLTSFGELVERNLRSLPRNESLQLEGRIMQLMYEFLGSRVYASNSLNVVQPEQVVQSNIANPSNLLTHIGPTATNPPNIIQSTSLRTGLHRSPSSMHTSNAVEIAVTHATLKNDDNYDDFITVSDTE